jgi:hypothetical protein
MINRWRKQDLRRRVLFYAAAAILAFAVAAGVGATVALMLDDRLNVSGGQEPQPAAQQGDAPQRHGAAADEPQEKDAGAWRKEEATLPLSEAEYVGRVGDTQSSAVETFMDSHDKLLRYDALTSQDIDEMRANEAALEETTREADDLAPPRGYEEQHEVFVSAVAGLHETARMAYELANDPVAAAEIGFDGYDARVDRVAGLLERSNEMLGRDYKTTKGAREISPELSAKEAMGGLERA